MSDTIEIHELAVLKKDLSNEERMQFDTQFAMQRKNPTVALLCALFFGLAGVDRFYVGDVGLGFAKLFTLGGLGIWALIDLFMIMGVARRKNSTLGKQLHDVIVQTRTA